jgi:type 1 fimbriae regulatory protein FimB/type 1 fimbriae regulatory protein FimE
MKPISLAHSPTTEVRTVPLRLPNSALSNARTPYPGGSREADRGLLAFRHGLRAGEVVDLQWEQIDFAGAVLHVRRIKNGSPSTHPLTGRELRALRQHQRESSRSPSSLSRNAALPSTLRGSVGWWSAQGRPQAWV